MTPTPAFARIPFSSLAAGCLLAMVAMLPAPAHAETCLEQIVVLQKRVDAVQGKPATPAAEPQSIGAQLNHEPTPGSVAAATGNLPPPVGPAAALNAAQNFQAAGDEASCLKAVKEARDMLEGR
ncbi:hypothetical protein V5F77_02175 [Xanthobacter sp. DSM 24535]|uniref:hypothetical protein n=1 Tax=Roseixanthobacter psychrophilus TaxID=3119917 RepID=UPI00372774D2